MILLEILSDMLLFSFTKSYYLIRSVSSQYRIPLHHMVNRVYSSVIMNSSPYIYTNKKRDCTIAVPHFEALALP